MLKQQKALTDHKKMWLQCTWLLSADQAARKQNMIAWKATKIVLL